MFSQLVLILIIKNNDTVTKIQQLNLKPFGVQGNRVNNMYIIMDNTNNTGRDVLTDGNELSNDIADAIKFETKEEAQQYIIDNELNVLKPSQMEWATIVQVNEEYLLNN